MILISKIGAFIIAVIAAWVGWRWFGIWSAPFFLLAGWWLAGVLERAIVTRTDPIEPTPEGLYRVACVGDSITYGTFVEDRPQNCYPAVLQRMLGPKVAVRNFGVPGATMSPIGDMPYRKYKPFKLATEFLPRVVIIMLGTNDSKSQNWLGSEKFEQYARGMITHFCELPSKPKIFVMTPSAAFLLPGKRKLEYGMQAAPMEEMARILRQLAKGMGFSLIDIRDITTGHPEGFDFDGIHTNTFGAKMIAEAVHLAIRDDIQAELA